MAGIAVWEYTWPAGAEHQELCRTSLEEIWTSKDMGVELLGGLRGCRYGVCGVWDA